MFESIKKVFILAITFFSCNALKCVSMNNQECKVRPEIKNIDSNEPSFSPYSILGNKYSGSCPNINDTFVKLYVSDAFKKINVKVFNLISRTNESRPIKLNENCKYKCRLDASVCNNKQCWNNDKYRCECKELIDKETCYKTFIWNSSNCECECNVGQNLDYKNFKCGKKLIYKSVEECSENIDGNEMI